jgi:hypothetical protein
MGDGTPIGNVDSIESTPRDSISIKLYSKKWDSRATQLFGEAESGSTT